MAAQPARAGLLSRGAQAAPTPAHRGGSRARRASRDAGQRLADRDQVERVFLTLAPEQRALLVLHFYLGLPLPRPRWRWASPWARSRPASTAPRRRCAPCSMPTRVCRSPRGRRPDVRAASLRRRPLLHGLAGTRRRCPTARRPLERVLEATAATRRRPAWLVLERWFPIPTRARFGAIPRTALILIVLATFMAARRPSALGSEPSADPSQVRGPGAFASAPAMTLARASHTATLLADGRILVVGGEGDHSRSRTRSSVTRPPAISRPPDR